MGAGWGSFAGEAELCPCLLADGSGGLQLPPSCGVWEMGDLLAVPLGLLGQSRILHSWQLCTHTV